MANDLTPTGEKWSTSDGHSYPNEMSMIHPDSTVVNSKF